MRLAAAAIACLVALGLTASNAIAAAPNITFTASGTFAAAPVSGNDSLLLAGEPFSISVVANASMTPSQHGGNWAVFAPLNMQGSITSGLLGSSTPISSPQAGIYQATGSRVDVFKSGFPIVVVGISLSVRAEIKLPAGTLSTALIHPIAPVALGPGNATVTYTDGTLSTTLAVAGGSLLAAKASGADALEGSDLSPAPVVLHAGGAQVVTVHPDGTQVAKAIGAGPVAPVSGAQVMLKFYASGVRDSASVHVRIAGVEVPVLYAGKSGYYPGLDEIHVLLPGGLAGRGSADVVLTVNGQASTPLHIQIQ